MSEFPDQPGYLSRLAKPLDDKLRVAKFISLSAPKILDVGCADGRFTATLHNRLPGAQTLGIDVNHDFITQAKKIHRFPNLKFNKACLRNLLNYEDRYDVIVFISSLHEIFTYGGGMAGVLMALIDAYQLLKPDGIIIIRDMILKESSKLNFLDLSNKIYVNKSILDKLMDFTTIFGPIETLYNSNHFLLKYFYDENWTRECQENYVPVTIEQYLSIFSLLDMRLEHQESYLLEFLRDKWVSDYSFSSTDLSHLLSTTVLVVKKEVNDISSLIFENSFIPEK